MLEFVCVILFFTLDLGRNGSDQKNSEAGKLLSICLFFKHLSLSMLISFMLIKKKNVLNSSVVIYFAWSGILFSTSLIFVLRKVVVTKLLVSGILFSTSLNFVFKTVVMTTPLVSGIFFYQPLQFFSLNFVYLCCINLCELK